MQEQQPKVTTRKKRSSRKKDDAPSPATQLPTPINTLMDNIAATWERYNKIREKRDEMTKSMNAELDQLAKQYGVPKKAMRATIKFFDMAEDKRDAFDMAVFVCRKAMSCEVQKDLFEQAPRFMAERMQQRQGDDDQAAA